MPTIRKEDPGVTPIASNKELRKVGVLLVLAIAMGAFLFYSFTDLQKDQKKPKSGGPIEINAKKLIENNNDKIKPAAFVEDKKILKDITADKFLKLPAYYYLLHQAISLKQEDIAKQVNSKLEWHHFIKESSRETIRGKFMKVRGNLVDLQKEVLPNTKYAKKNKLNGYTIWRGAIYTIDAHLYLFAVTHLPKGIKKGNGVELLGAFYKIWLYESMKGQTHAPFVIGKTLRVLPVRESQARKRVTIIFLFIFALTCIVLGYAIYAERKEARAFWEYQQQRKREKARKNFASKNTEKTKESDIDNKEGKESETDSSDAEESKKEAKELEKSDIEEEKKSSNES